jgi:hypothetical protein
MLIPDLLGPGFLRVIYLDCDVIVEGDITDLWVARQISVPVCSIFPPNVLFTGGVSVRWTIGMKYSVTNPGTISIFFPEGLGFIKQNYCC